VLVTEAVINNDGQMPFYHGGACSLVLKPELVLSAGTSGPDMARDAVSLVIGEQRSLIDDIELRMIIVVDIMLAGCGYVAAFAKYSKFGCFLTLS
jgi:hypothetical protein